MREEAEANDRLELLSGPEDWPFDAEGSRHPHFARLCKSVGSNLADLNKTNFSFLN
jgi:hypothetical protein